MTRPFLCVPKTPNSTSTSSKSGDPGARFIIWGLRRILTIASPLDFPHDHARSRAYRWGEDGIAGVCDTHGYENIAFAFWNEKECVCSLST